MFDNHLEECEGLSHSIAKVHQNHTADTVK